MKTSKGNNWESRLARLEKDVRTIKSKLEERSPKQGWHATVGCLGGDPVFEIRRVTMELIEKERERDKRRISRRAAKAKK